MSQTAAPSTRACAKLSCLLLLFLGFSIFSSSESQTPNDNKRILIKILTKILIKILKKKKILMKTLKKILIKILRQDNTENAKDPERLRGATGRSFSRNPWGAAPLKRVPRHAEWRRGKKAKRKKRNNKH